MPIIQVEQLTKQFTRRKKRPGFWGGLTQLVSPDHEVITAVDQVSFNVEQGEIIGYIGPNGAGKSTTMKMLTGILVPTAGTLQVAGCVPHQQRTEHARHIGVVFGQRTHLWWDVPVIDSLHLLRDIYKVSEAQFRANLEIFNDLLELNEFQNVPVRQLSLGQRVRADIAAALLHNPTILFLDEPTIGVDAISKDRLRTFIKEINHDRQVTILLTTHDMGEIEKLSSRVIIIDHGRLKYDGGLGDLTRRIAPFKRIGLLLGEPCPCDLSVYGVPVEGGEEEGKQYVQVKADEVAAITARMLSDLPVRDLTIEDPPIENVIERAFND